MSSKEGTVALIKMCYETNKGRVFSDNRANGHLNILHASHIENNENKNKRNHQPFITDFTDLGSNFYFFLELS